MLTFSENDTKHLKHIKKVFKALDGAGLEINLEKCHFFLNELVYLRYNLHQQGIEIYAERIRLMKDYIPLLELLMTCTYFLEIDPRKGGSFPTSRKL